MKLKLTKEAALSALESAPLCAEFHDNVTARCGSRNSVSAVGALLRTLKWNFHIWDSQAAIRDSEFLCQLETAYLDALLLTKDPETARLYAMFLVQFEMGPEIELDFYAF